MDKKAIKVTVLVQTRNEAASIERCINSLRNFDEVIVVDSDSTDSTKDIARSLGAKVVNFTWSGEYPKKKQWQLENVHTRNPWVLFLDADEAPTAALESEIADKLETFERSGVVAADIPLQYVFSGSELKYGHQVVKRVLLRKERVCFPRVDDLQAPGMGELEGHYQPEARGRVARLDAKMLHHDVDPVSTWFERHNRYSDWEAYLRTHPASLLSVRRLRSKQGQLFERAPLKPLAFFVYSYVLRQGWRDGQAGLDYAIALAFYYWQIGLKTRERGRGTQEMTA